jgi:hypothetical protein
MAHRRWNRTGELLSPVPRLSPSPESRTLTLTLTATLMADLLDDADIDFERAASAFPDISLDGEGDIPAFTSPPPRGPPPPAGPFDLDAFGGPAPARQVRVTGDESDDDIEKFESDFPELDVPQV